MNKKKSLNLPLIKSIIVFFVATLTGIGSAITGIASQLAFAPMLTWMFGYRIEKAQATALRYAIIVAGVAFFVATYLLESWVVMIWRVPLLFFAATLGAMLGGPLTPKQEHTTQRRMYHSLGILLAVFVTIQATQLNNLTNHRMHFLLWDEWWSIGGLGIAIGFVAKATGLAISIFMVPALFFLTGALGVGTNAYQAVITSLGVTMLASALPNANYSRNGLVDKTYLVAMTLGGIAGGFLGGWLLVNLVEKAVLSVFGLVAMFLSARELAKLVMQTPDKPENVTEDKE